MDGSNVDTHLRPGIPLDLESSARLNRDGPTRRQIAVPDRAGDVGRCWVRNEPAVEWCSTDSTQRLRADKMPHISIHNRETNARWGWHKDRG